MSNLDNLASETSSWEAGRPLGKLEHVAQLVVVGMLAKFGILPEAIKTFVVQSYCSLSDASGFSPVEWAGAHRKQSMRGKDLLSGSHKARL